MTSISYDTNLHNKLLNSDEIVMCLAHFPFQTSLSLHKIIEYWGNKLDSGHIIGEMIAKELLPSVKAIPALSKPITDLSIIENNRELVDTLLSAIFPPALQNNDLACAVHPYGFNTLYTTPAFANELAPDFEQMKSRVIMDERMLYFKTIHAYTEILRKAYNVDILIDRPIIFAIKNTNNDLVRYYKSDFNSEFVDVIVSKKAPKLSEEKISYLLDNMNNLEIWTETLPPKHFELRGFAVMRLTDVTDQEILSKMKQSLLEKNAIILDSKFEELKNQLRILFNAPDMHMGVAAFQRNRGGFVNFGKNSCNSFILKNTEGIRCPFSAGGAYQQVVETQKPVIIKDLESKDSPTEFEKDLLQEGIKNLIIAPLHYEGDFMGVLEMASTQADVLNAASLLKMDEILPLFSIAVNRSSEELKANVQSIIKEECTAIHPTVEWKFIQAAYDLLDRQNMGEEGAEMAPIVFENVHPLYGASDVRSSSSKRNQAIQADLTQHLTLAKQVLKTAAKVDPLPIFEEIRYKVNKHIKNIRSGLSSGDEVGILDFLKREVESLFPHLQQKDKSIATAIEKYQKAIDTKLGVLYDKRKDFEESLTKINETVSALIDKKQVEAQKMFPHYFEKYKTDGIEYNIYVGATLVENRDSFDNIYLKNLRLWQLLTTCEIARKTATLVPQLKVPLETTHLILIHSAPLAIRFRTEEKHFDVDGAYNIRYEIIKKRIDKAYIRDTEERLTQPGKIAIVYSQAKEAYEYREYIEYLQSMGWLEKEVEDVELEKLQGVQGLKALRVTVKMPDHQPDNQNGRQQLQDELTEAMVG